MSLFKWVDFYRECSILGKMDPLWEPSTTVPPGVPRSAHKTPRGPDTVRESVYEDTCPRVASSLSRWKFFACFFDPFLPNISIFSVYGVFLRAKGTPCPPPLACRFMTPRATGCISPAPSVRRSAPPPKRPPARSAPIAGRCCIPAVAPRRPWRSPPIGWISRRRSSRLRVRRNAAPASTAPCPSRPRLLDALDLVHGLRDRATRTYLWTWSLKTAYTRVIEIMARAGIAGPQASPKGLRHGFGVACIEKGIPLNLVQRWLGHAQLSTTAIYADAVGEEERHIAARLWT